MAEFIDVSDLKDLAKVLAKVEKQYQLDLYKAIGAAGEVVAVQARRNAENIPRKGTGTNRIRNSIHAKRRGLSVKIDAGGDGAPEAAPIFNGGKGGKFRHPVFGDKAHWVDQNSYPFLGIDEVTADAGFAIVVAGVDSALRGISVV